MGSVQRAVVPALDGSHPFEVESRAGRPWPRVKRQRISPFAQLALLGISLILAD